MLVPAVATCHGAAADVEVRRSRGAVAAWSRGGSSRCDFRDWWQLPVASAPPSQIGLGVRTVGIVAATNLVCRATNPTSLFYMALRNGGPPAVLGWASPIRTRVKVGPVVGLARWRSILTFSPLISPLYFKISQFELNSLLSL